MSIQERGFMAKKAVKKTTQKKASKTAGKKSTTPALKKTVSAAARFQVHLHANDISQLQGQSIAFFSHAAEDKNKAAFITEADLNEVFEVSLEEKHLTGAANEVVFYREANLNNYRHVFVVGLGAKSKLTHEGVRSAAAALVKEAKAQKCEEVFVHIDGLSSSKKDINQYVKAFVEGLSLCAYLFDEYKSNSKDAKTLQFHLVSQGAKDKAMTAAFQEAIILSEAANFAKYLGDSPGNGMTPTILAEKAIAAAVGTGLKVTAWDKKRIEKERMGGLLGVAQGSEQEPRFIVMEYNGGKKSDKPIAFVGKGLTFDTGGISLKPGAKMEEMKYDMCGGAAVIGTMLAIARLKLKVNVVAFVPATENMPSGKATKPGDIHKARNGKTFEVNNTDAEGRLILSDALCYASEHKPQLLIDTATLTGAIIVALGNIHTGYFTRDKKLRTQIEAAAENSGELVWAMPLVDHHVKDMKGTFADLSNISSGNGAGSATAAAFLEQFVDKEIPWAHFDIAGTAWACGNRLNYCSAKGATGVMVRTFVEIAKQYE